MKISILIVDSQQLLRAGLREILSRQQDFEIVDDLGDAPSAIELAARSRPDVVIIEDRQPGSSGIEAIRRIRAESPQTACIVLTDAEGTLQVRQAIVAGASGFLAKNASAADLVEAVRTVARGGSYLSPAATNQVIDTFRSPAHESLGSSSLLTSRQQQVLRLIAEGMSTKEIAAELGISEKTAQTHRAKLMGKTGIRKASGLVRYAIREGLVAP